MYLFCKQRTEQICKKIDDRTAAYHTKDRSDLHITAVNDKQSIVRVIVDASFVAAGFCLGGVFGIGTIICAGLVGPTAGICLPVSEKIVDKVLGGVLK